MKTWPPRLNAGVFIKACRTLLEDPEQYEYCPLRAILVDQPSRDNFIEMYVARAFFVYLFRPRGVKAGAHWWPKEIDAPIIALCLAAELAKEFEYQLGADNMIEVFKECTKDREHQFEVGQAALLKRALAAESRPPIDAPLQTRLAHEHRNL